MAKWFETQENAKVKNQEISGIIVQDNLPQKTIVEYEMIINPIDVNSKEFFKDW